MRWEMLFQATYILESVISNFVEFDEIVAEAKGELALIKSGRPKVIHPLIPTAIKNETQHATGINLYIFNYFF